MAATMTAPVSKNKKVRETETKREREREEEREKSERLRTRQHSPSLSSSSSSSSSFLSHSSTHLAFLSSPWLCAFSSSGRISPGTTTALTTGLYPSSRRRRIQVGSSTKAPLRSCSPNTERSTSERRGRSLPKR